MIEKYLSQEKLVQSVLTTEDLKDKVSSGRTLNIMMGQTFDGGEPVDLLKYGLFIMNFSDILKGCGVEVNARWLIADHFITDINQELEAASALDQASRRVSFLQTLNSVYGGNIGIVRSSQLSQQDGYKHNVELLLAEADRNITFKEQALRAVPEDRRSNPNALRYPFEELATIQSMDTDIKVGPPYEIHYDEPGREIAHMVGFNRYVAIHLTRGFPFGNPIIPSSTIEEIEAFGILPYKKGSKGLGDYRIDPTVDSIERVGELISSTADIRAVVDLLVITDLARQRIDRPTSLKPEVAEEGSKKMYDMTSEKQDSETLKELALGSYIRYIHKPLHAG